MSRTRFESNSTTLNLSPAGGPAGEAVGSGGWSPCMRRTADITMATNRTSWHGKCNAEAAAEEEEEMVRTPADSLGS